MGWFFRDEDGSSTEIDFDNLFTTDEILFPNANFSHSNNTSETSDITSSSLDAESDDEASARQNGDQIGRQYVVQGLIGDREVYELPWHAIWLGSRIPKKCNPLPAVNFLRGIRGGCRVDLETKKYENNASAIVHTTVLEPLLDMLQEYQRTNCLEGAPTRAEELLFVNRFYNKKKGRILSEIQSTTSIIFQHGNFIFEEIKCLNSDARSKLVMKFLNSNQGSYANDTPDMPPATNRRSNANDNAKMPAAPVGVVGLMPEMTPPEPSWLGPPAQPWMSVTSPSSTSPLTESVSQGYRNTYPSSQQTPSFAAQCQPYSYGNVLPPTRPTQCSAAPRYELGLLPHCNVIPPSGQAYCSDACQFESFGSRISPSEPTRPSDVPPATSSTLSLVNAPPPLQPMHRSETSPSEFGSPSGLTEPRMNGNSHPASEASSSHSPLLSFAIRKRNQLIGFCMLHEISDFSENDATHNMNVLLKCAEAAGDELRGEEVVLIFIKMIQDFWDKNFRPQRMIPHINDDDDNSSGGENQDNCNIHDFGGSDFKDRNVQTPSKRPRQDQRRRSPHDGSSHQSSRKASTKLPDFQISKVPSCDGPVDTLQATPSLEPPSEMPLCSVRLATSLEPFLEMPLADDSMSSEYLGKKSSDTIDQRFVADVCASMQDISFQENVVAVPVMVASKPNDVIMKVEKVCDSESKSLEKISARSSTMDWSSHSNFGSASVSSTTPATGVRWFNMESPPPALPTLQRFHSGALPGPPPLFVGPPSLLREPTNMPPPPPIALPFQKKSPCPPRSPVFAEPLPTPPPPFHPYFADYLFTTRCEFEDFCVEHDIRDVRETPDTRNFEALLKAAETTTGDINDEDMVCDYISFISKYLDKFFGRPASRSSSSQGDNSRMDTDHQGSDSDDENDSDSDQKPLSKPHEGSRSHQARSNASPESKNSNATPKSRSPSGRKLACVIVQAKSTFLLPTQPEQRGNCCGTDVPQDSLKNVLLDRNACQKAAASRDLVLLKHAHEESCRWARANGCTWNSQVCALAKQNGHLKILQWARANGCPQSLISSTTDSKHSPAAMAYCELIAQ